MLFDRLLGKKNRRDQGCQPRAKQKRRLLIEGLEERAVFSLGGSQAEAAYSAKQILQASPGAPSGIYWVDPTGGSTADAFQVYADMVTDGGGWMLGLNSVNGSRSATTDMVSNTGNVGLATGQTRDMSVYAINGTAELRHEIIGTSAGLGIFDRKYTGKYHDALATTWTALPANTSTNLLTYHFGQPWQTSGGCASSYGQPWYYGSCWSTIPAQNNLSYSTNGPVYSGTSTPLDRYSIWVRETVTPPLTTAASLDGSGNFVFTDVSNSTNDNLELSVSGGNLVLFSPAQLLTTSVGAVSADGHTITVPLTSITGSKIILNTAGGDDFVTVDSSVSTSGKRLEYSGGAGGDDGLKLVGTGGASSATYTPSASTTGDGTVLLNDTTTLTFTGLEPVDLTGFGTATVASPVAATNALAVAAGFDSATGTIPALVVTGNTGLGATMIESAHLYNNTTVVLDTSATAGSNTITSNGFALGHNNTNLQLKANALGQVSFNTAATNISGALDVQGGVANVNQAINIGPMSAITGAVPLVSVTSPGQIQDGIDMAAANATVNVAAGTYTEDLTATKSGLHLFGANAATTTVVGPIGGTGSTLAIAASNVEVAKLTLTRAGNNPVDWNNPGLNSAGISVQGTSITGLLAHDMIITGMRTAIDINNSSGHTIRNSVITQNRTGLIFRNQTDNITFVENAVTDNFTVGILFLDASGGTNSPVQSAANSNFSNNNISGNWYGQIVDRQTGGSLPAPGTTNLKNFSNNWFGTATPVITNADSTEPGYAAQIPAIFGGGATAPGGQPDVLGPAVANFDITPYLHTGVDTNVETTPGRGTFGFQGDFSSLHATAQLAQTGATGRIQEAVNRVTASGTVYVTAGTYPENVDVNKTITLLGAQAGVDGRNVGRTGLPATESVLRGAPIGADRTTSLSVGANNVVIDGFTVQETSNANVFGAAIYVKPGFAGTAVRNNIVQNNLVGLFLANNNAANPAIVEKNLFRNNNLAGPAGGHDIYADEYTAGTLNGAIIDNNKFTNAAMVVDSWALGLSNTSATPFANITFSNNTVDNHGRGLYAYGTQNANITGNTFTGMTNYAVGIFESGVLPNSGFSITNNQINNADVGIRVEGAGAYTGTLAPSNNTITGGTYYLRNLGGADINAVGNTYGGVLLDGSTTVAQIYTISDKMLDAVDVAGAGRIILRAGHQFVTPNSFDAAFGSTQPSIQRAIDAATSGDVIHIQSGTYFGGADATAGGKNVTLAAGSSPGQVTINGNLVLNAGDVLAIEINGTNSTTDYDNFIVNGTVSLGSATLTITGTYTPTATDGFILISNDSNDAVTGIFAGLPPTTLVNVNGTNMRILYTGSSGNDVVLAPQFVPVAYVEDTAWNALNVGDVIPDADFGTASSEPAIYGYNAFNSITSALAALTSTGIVIVNDGTYAESPTLDATKSLLLTKFNPATNGTVTVNSLDSVAGTTIDLGPNTLQLGDNVTNNTLAGLVMGAGNLVKQGTDVLTLSNSSNTFSGTTINGGTIAVADVANAGFSSPLGAGTTIALNGGTLRFTGPSDSSNRPINIGANHGGIEVTNGGTTLALSGNVTGGNNISKFGAGMLNWQAAAAAFNNVFISGGTLELDGAGTYTVANVIQPGSSTLDGSFATGNGTLNIKGTAIVNAGAVSVNNQSSTVGIVNQSGGTLNVSGLFRIGHWPNATGTYNLTAGTINLTGAPAAQVNLGSVPEQPGVVYLGVDGTGVMTMSGGALNATAIVLDGRGDTGGTDTFTLTGGTVTLGNNANATTKANSGIFRGNNNANTTYQVNLGGGTIVGINSWTANVNLNLTGTNGNVTFNPNPLPASSAAVDMTLSGILSGVGGLRMAGTGTNAFVSTLVINNAGNNFSGATQIDSGRVRMDSTGKLGTSAVTVTATDPSSPFNGNGQLWVNGASLANAVTISGNGLEEAAGQLGAIRFSGGTLSGPITLAANSRIHTHSAGDTGLISGNIGGAFNLEKTGAGTLTLSGVNGYTGTTTITGGTLLVNGNLADGAAANDVIVNNGTVLGGSGNIGGAAIVNAGGKITGGTLGGVGTLTLVGGLSFNGGQYAADISGDASDTLVAGGVVDLVNTTVGTFAINTQAGTPSDNNVFTLINKTAAGAITDTPFSGLAEGSSTTVGGKTAVYSYAGGDGNNFTLTVAGTPTLTFGGNLEVRRVTSGPIDNVQLLQNGVIVDSRPLASIIGTYTVTGNSAADFLLINYTNIAPASGFIPRNITFNGGAGGSDKLQILGGTFDNVTHTFLSANDGTILLDPTGPGANQTVQYTGLEPVLMNVGSATNIIFNLPGTADNAILEDDNELVTNTSQLRSINGTFERTTFTHPTGSLTVNAGAGDNLTVATTEAFATASVNLFDADTIAISSLSAGGNAKWRAVNSITQTGPFTVTGNLELTTNGVNAPVTLFNASNQIGGEITLTATGNAQLRDTLGAMVFYLTSVGGNLTVQSDGGDILQTGAFFTINGTSSFRTTQNNADILLNTLPLSAIPNNDFIGAVSLFTVGPTGNASIGDRNALNIGLSTVGGTLFAHAENGNLTSSDTVTAGGTVTFDASAAILDGNAGDNIIAPAAELRATTGIGSSNPLETKISQLAALNTTSNNIQIANTSGTLLTLTTLNTTVGVKNNGPGTVEIFNDANGITVAADSNAGSLFQLTTTDTAATTETITVNPGFTVQSDGIIDFNAGDNFSIPLNATLSALGVVTLDSLDTAADALGSTFDFFGNVDAANISFTGNAQNDVFNIQLDNIAPLTHMNVDGKAPSFPTPLPGDTLNLFALGTPTLIVNGIGSGQWTGVGQATLDYIDIETVTANVPYHLAIDMGAPGLLAQNSVDARLDDAASANFEVRVDTDLDARDGTLAFQGPVGNVVSFAVLGSNDGEAFSVTQNAQNLLPGQTGGFNGSSPYGQPLNASYIAAGRTPTAPNAPPIHFTGNGNAVGSDIFRFNLNLAEDVGYFADNSGSGDVNVQGKLAVSFNGNEFVDINQLAIGGSIVVDSSSYAALSTMTITDTVAPVLGAVTQVDGDAGFADARFKNFANVTIRSGLGQDLIDLVSINPVGLVSVVLDSDSVQNSDVNSPVTNTTADDTVRLRSLPATASALLKGSPGRDTYQLYDANFTVDNILGPVTVGGLTPQDNPGEVGNNLASQVAQDQDKLIIIDSGSADLTGAIVNVTETTVDGLTGFGGIDVTYSNIDYLDVTATSGPDHIYVNMANGLSDLNTATVRGSEGKDLFDIIPGVENFVPTAALPVNQLQKFTDLFLFGDGPNVNTAGDIFGYDDFIRPSKTVIINIDGGVPSVVAPPGNFPAVPVDQLPYQLSNDAPSYDRLNLNMARGGAPQTDVLATSTIPVVVDTVGDPLTGTGTATSASHTIIKFRDIEYFNVWDKDGPTNVQRGDLYVRSSESNDSMILYPDMRYTSGAPNGFTFQALKIRYNNKDIGPYYQTNNSVTSPGKWIVYGRQGNDNISVNNWLTRDTEIFGGSGNDYIAGSNTGGKDLLVGGWGNDRLQSLASDDVIYGDRFPEQLEVVGVNPFRPGRPELATDPGVAGVDTMNGGNGNDVLDGGAGNDNEHGENGDDIVYGGDGNDTLGGDAGLDIVIGGNGNDRVNGGMQRDILIGGMGVDNVDGDQEQDIVVGDASKWDTHTFDTDVALLALMFGPTVPTPGSDYWSNMGSTYTARTIDGSYLQGQIAPNLIDDGSIDTIVGDLDLDWYFDVVVKNDKYSGRVAATEKLN